MRRVYLALVTGLTCFVGFFGGVYVTNTDNYALFDTRFGQTNTLEIEATGSSSVSVSISLYNQSAKLLKKSSSITIPAKKMTEVDINNLLGTSSIVGLIKVHLNRTGSTVGISGRNIIKRKGTSSYEFAYAHELSSGMAGNRYVLAKNTDAEENVISRDSNSLFISNLGTKKFYFGLRLYNKDGAIVYEKTSYSNVAGNRTKRIEVNSLKDSGDYVVEIIPKNTTDSYIASLVRMRTNAEDSSVYSFAYAVDASPGLYGEQYIVASARTAQCWEENNKLQVVNLSAASATVEVTYLTKGGAFVATEDLTIDANGKTEVDLNSRISSLGQGLVKIGTAGQNLLVQNVVSYEALCSSKEGASFAVLGKQAGQSSLVSSYNRVNGETNLVQVANVSAANGSFKLVARPYPYSIGQGSVLRKSYTVNSAGEKSVNLFTTSPFSTKGGEQGSLEISSASSGVFFAQEVRTLEVDGVIEYAFPVIFSGVQLFG